MLLFIGQVIIIYIVYIVAIRILGKTALAQLTPQDFGAIFFLAYLLFGSIKIQGISQGIVGVIVVVVIYLSISKLSLWNKLNKLLMGEPTFLIKNGEIMPANLRSSRYTLMELLSSIRTAGYLDIDEVDYALLEPNGNISILSQNNRVANTQSQLNLSTVDEGFPIAVIVEGKVQLKNLKSIMKDHQWLKEELLAQGHSDIKKIFLATVKDKNYLLKIYAEQ
ncbi:DUF421 domain-containing protein [Aquibacillus halophilus]|uniref:DUF421 domain-containing protein n=1 Tax=Aquibacillus halophilus TaxID=930132 RepID=A0A6A8DF39_9BACI|nr:YetF domain-containing protein [Aquibacillus halophilus]MRH43840.1 DUF421 domain-containing protein [Aquibacillus halophilus]